MILKSIKHNYHQKQTQTRTHNKNLKYTHESVLLKTKNFCQIIYKSHTLYVISKHERNVLSNMQRKSLFHSSQMEHKF